MRPQNNPTREKKNTTKEKKMIYHILIDRFDGGWKTPPQNVNGFLGGTIKGITQRLDYIQSLGATAVWLSPFLKTESYHGYHITDYEAVEPRFGTWEDLRTLIGEAHSRGMKVISDFVPNHCYETHPFFQEALANPESPYRKWFFFKGKRNEYKSFLSYTILPKFNLTYKPAAEYMYGIAENLIKIGIDGLRVDHALGVPMPFLKELRTRVHKLNPQATVVGEIWQYNVPRKLYSTLYFRNAFRRLYYTIFGMDQESVQLSYKGVLDGVLDFEFRNIMLEEIESGRGVEGNSRLEKKLRRHFARYSKCGLTPVLFLDNHDTDRILFRCGQDKKLLEQALQVMKNCGEPYIIYYGTEIFMTNESTIENAEPYADLRVREAMAWE